MDRQGESRDRLQRLLCFAYQGTEPSHARIDFEMDGGQAGGLLGKEPCLPQRGDSRDETMPGNLTIFGGEGGAEQQDRGFLLGLAKEQGLSQRGHGEDLHAVTDGGGDLVESVSVAVGFDDRHDAGIPRDLFDGFEIMPQRGTVDLDPGSVGERGGLTGHRVIMSQETAQ